MPRMPTHGLAFLALLALSLVLGSGVATALAQPRCEAGGYPPTSQTERFDDNGDGTVTDRQSRLMWMRCSAGQSWRNGTCMGSAAKHNWLAAQRMADEVNRDGTFFYNDWRVPQLRELAMIAERGCDTPRINQTIFPATPAQPYWSTTLRPGANDNGTALALSFGADGVRIEQQQSLAHVRLVRTAF